MSRAYSQDLRDRVIDAALKEALSARAAAARFGVGIATAIVWVRRARETGSRAARPRGQTKRQTSSKLQGMSRINELWPKLGDDDVRKAAYRGGC